MIINVTDILNISTEYITLRGSVYKQGLAFILSWIGNHMPCKSWDVLEWMSNVTPRCIMWIIRPHYRFSYMSAEIET